MRFVFFLDLNRNKYMAQIIINIQKQRAFSINGELRHRHWI